MAEFPEPTSPDRREFLKRVGFAGLGTTLAGPAIAFAQSAAPKPGTPKPAAADTSHVTPAAAPEAPSDAAKALAQVIHIRYGAFLDADQMKDVTEEIDQRISGGEALRKAKLANGDEPDFTFKP
jgi:hypothetical protein